MPSIAQPLLRPASLLDAPQVRRNVITPRPGDRWVLEELRRLHGPTCADLSLLDFARYVDERLRISRLISHLPSLKDERGFLQFAQQGALLGGVITYQVDYVVVGPGGKGGDAAGLPPAGGGGGGGVVIGVLTAVPGLSYTVTVGLVATASSFNGTTAGPGGLGGQNGFDGGNGSDGSAGGGGAAPSGLGGSPRGSASPGANFGGNGGGATGTATAGISGGEGTLNDYSGTPTIYGPGAGGGRDDGEASGYPGGTNGGVGAGNANAATSGVIYGSGGGGATGVFINGAPGYQGVLIARYIGLQRGTNGTVTSSGIYTIHTFTTSASFIG